MNGWLKRGGLRHRLLLSHLLTIAAGALTLLTITIIFAPGLHDQLMIAWLGPHWTETADTSMVEMERATNAIFTLAMIQALTISSGAAVTVAIIVSLVASRQIMQPIDHLLQTTRRIAAGHYAERAPLLGDRELTRLAAQFNLMAEALERAEQRRVALIGDVAHELRTPLATIAGYVEGILDGVVETDEATWALVLDEVNRLRRLTDDLQQLSRVESRQITLAPTPVDPAHLIEAAVTRLIPQFTAKNIELHVNIEPHLPPVWADSDRILQVLINLLGNALQYTPDGGRVVIGAEHAGEAIRFLVQDSGIGIATEHLPHLFERFYRVDKSRTRATGGAGIGLTICKGLVSMHGGQIWATSTGPGCGATFYFTLPLYGHHE
ncbi:sensor histidine kinase [Chloroflexus sp.]|uniref:sensor histidine kinase n=1 Tax=Chloroflexus sp. TaxID=1904827 RepID=UPI002ADD79CE|nr:ATP-binding protein [Chloroflexus sp.]